MKCAVHPEVDATGYCRNCGKPLCPNCTREVNGMLYCAPCLTDIVARQQVVAAPSGSASPGLAATLGMVPGLGAVYNGQYIKALVHVLIFAMLIAICNGTNGSAQVFFGLMIPAWILYMMLDAYVCAKARREGRPMPDYLGSAAPAGPVASVQAATVADAPVRNPRIVGPVILIAIGFLFLLHNFDLFDLDRLFDRWWPLVLIFAGAGLAWRQMNVRRQ